MPKSCVEFANYIKRQILFKIAYNGRSYSGMAYNKDQTISIEKVLFGVLVKMCLIPLDFTLKSINFSRCGRTDAGVSATGNYVCMAVFLRDSSGFDFSRMNVLLAPNIAITEWSYVPSTFNARFDCNKRIYKYSFFGNGYDFELMDRACEKLKGKHDFRNFCRIRVCDNTNFVREIYSFGILKTELENLYEFEIAGSGFVTQQVRYMVAVIFLVGKKLESPEIIDYLLDLHRCPSKPTYGPAPPEPLRLYDCQFKSSSLLKFQRSEGLKINLMRNLEIRRRKKIMELNYLNDLIRNFGDTNEINSTVFEKDKKYKAIKNLDKDITLEEKIINMKNKRSKKIRTFL